MNFPAIPENLSELSDEALATLRAALRTFALDVVTRAKSENLSDDDMGNARLAKATIDQIDALSSQRAEAAAELADLESSLEDEPEADEDADEATDDGDEDEDGDDLGDESGDDTEDESDEAVTASARPRAKADPARTSAKAGGITKAPTAPDALAQKFTALAGVSGFSAGDQFESMHDVSAALVERFKDIQGGGTERIGVAQIKGRFAEGTDLEPGLIGYGDPTDAITAGLDCVPREPIYDVGCDSSQARPFANSLPNRRAPRGGYSVYPSPKLSDVTDGSSGDGTGAWERSDDAVDSGSVKSACAVIPCGTPDDYDIWGVYRCLTVRNLHQMTHPELVAAFINKLGALWSRLAETTLMNAALNSPNLVPVDGIVQDDLGATVNILDNLVQTAMVYTEQERYDDGIRFGVWLHRWVLTLLIRDWMRTPKYNPTMADLVAARGEVEAAFSRAGFNVHWVIDSPEGWAEIGTQAAGDLEGLPVRADMLIMREGNTARLDEGSMTIGVTNRTPWDKDDMARNQFTMFWESYEGLIDYGCPSYSLKIDGICANGLVNYAPAEAPVCGS